MTYSATVKYVAKQITLGRLTYLGVTNSELFTVIHPEYTEQLDAYIIEFELTIDKMV